jgi:hypothetical protein
MIRALAISGSICLAACASVPLTPPQLIVGKWDCKLPTMQPGTFNMITFGRDHALHLDYDGGELSHGFNLEFRARLSGTYEFEGEALRAKFNAVQLESLVVDGRVVQGQMVQQLETLAMESANRSLATPIELLDGRRLVLAAHDSSPSMSCVRTTAGMTEMKPAQQAVENP